MIFKQRISLRDKNINEDNFEKCFTINLYESSPVLDCILLELTPITFH